MQICCVKVDKVPYPTYKYSLAVAVFFRAYLATPNRFPMGATSGAEPSYGSNLARRSKLILGLSAAVLGLFLVARIVVEDILPRFGISGGSSTLRWW